MNHQSPDRENRKISIQLSFSDIDTTQIHGRFSSDLPLKGTAAYQQAQELDTFIEKNELGQFLLGAALKRCGWDISYDGLDQRNPRARPWHLHHALFKTLPFPTAPAAAENAAHISIHYMLFKTLEDQHRICQLYPNLLLRKKPLTNCTLRTSNGDIVWPTVEQYLTEARSETIFKIYEQEQEDPTKNID